MAVIRLPDSIFTGDYGDVVTPVSGDNGKALVWNNAAQRAEWVSVAASPGGSSGYIQYNNAGAFGASGVYWDATNSRVGIGTSSPGAKLEIAGGASTNYLFIRSGGAGSQAGIQLFDQSTQKWNILKQATTNDLEFWRSGASSPSMMLQSSTGYIGIGTTPGAAVDLSASTTSRASLRIRSGTAPTSPNDGDIWFDGTNYKCRIGGVTKTFTVT